MTQPTIGFSFLLDREPRKTGSLAADYAALVTSSGWGREIRYLSSVAAPGQPLARRPGMVRPKGLREVIEQMILSTDTNVLRVATSARTDQTYADCSIDTVEFMGRRPQISGRRPCDLPETHARWLDALLALIDRAPSSHGAVFVMLDAFDVSREEDIVRSRAPGDPAHALYPQWARMSRHRADIGVRYVRFPRWGTLYSHAHVAQLGGVGAIVDAVQPAVVRELGGGVYVQLTDSLETALGDEAQAKQRAFEALVEPLLPPA